jgi:hypothetical protein
LHPHKTTYNLPKNTKEEKMSIDMNRLFNNPHEFESLLENNINVKDNNYLYKGRSHLEVLKHRHSFLVDDKDSLILMCRRIKNQVKTNEYKLYKKTKKEVDYKIKNFKYEVYFEDIKQWTTMFNQMLCIGLEIDYKTQNILIDRKLILNEKVKTFLVDKDFKKFLELCLFNIIVEQKYSDKLNTKHSVKLKTEMYDTFSIVGLYYLTKIKTENITPSKIRNILSYFINEDNVSCWVENETELQKSLFNQIKTGVKYEVLKKETTNNVDYKPRGNFSLYNYLSNRIRIKYFTNKHGEHLSHKSPVEHTRKGHYRHYKSGKTVWVNQSIINEGRKNEKINSI